MRPTGITGAGRQACCAGGASGLHDLADSHGDRVDIEHLGITDLAGIAALRNPLGGRSVDILFVNAATANMGDETTAEISTGGQHHQQYQRPA